MLASFPPVSSTTGSDRHSDWTPAHRFAFRVAFVYVALFAVASLLDVGPTPRALLGALRDPVVDWIGHTILRIREAQRNTGAQWALVQQVSAIAIATTVAAVWSLVARRTEYARLNGWFRTVLRYYVAVIMMVYGGFKIIDSQFPPISLEQLSQPVGALSPMGLLWAYMGYSSTYAAFTGLGESLGAFLLFFRRTTTAGALILCAVLSNVALINYVYDVPVKQLSTNLLLISILLAAGDARRLLATFVLNTATPAAKLDFVFPLWVWRIRRVAKPLIVVAATGIPIVASFFVHRNLERRSPLFGIYDVEEFTRNGQIMPPITTDSTRWRRVMFSRPGTMSIRMMSDSVRSVASSVDTLQRRIVSRARPGANDDGVFEYEPLAGNRLRLRGVADGDSVNVMLQRLDERRFFRLLRR